MAGSIPGSPVTSGLRGRRRTDPVSRITAVCLPQVYGIRTRSRAVEIFTTCAHMICNMEELEKVREPWAHSRVPIAGSVLCRRHTARGAGTLDPGRLSGVGGSVSSLSLISSNALSCSCSPRAQSSLVCHGLGWETHWERRPWVQRRLGKWVWGSGFKEATRRDEPTRD